MMHVETVTTDDRSLLPAVRHTLADADEALLCVAFANEQGIHLVAPALKKAHAARLAVTTVFGTTTSSGLGRARELGVDIGVLNPGSSTYHPKVYLGRFGDGSMRAVIGSANLTGGLYTNVEAGVLLDGRATDPPLARAWDWASGIWTKTRPWQALVAAEGGTCFEYPLLGWLTKAVEEDPIFMTLGPRPIANRVSDVTPRGLYVESGAGTGPQFVPAWMFLLAWDELHARKRMRNTTLLNDLRVHRSSAVCAILARLPAVHVVSRAPIELGLGARP